jgi:hypothetical protein
MTEQYHVLVKKTSAVPMAISPILVLTVPNVIGGCHE